MGIDSVLTRVTIVTVTFNSMAVLPRMLQSTPKGVKVVIVDNGSANLADLLALAKKYDASLVRNEFNHGFGRACNQGAALASTEFLLFLNPDARLDQGSLPALIAAADQLSVASAFNPAIFDENGRQKLKRKSHLLPRREWLPRGAGRRACELPFLHGSAIFVRRSAFLAVGGFDPRIFLFFEDDDLSLRLRQATGPLRLVTDAAVYHDGAASTLPTVSVRLFKAWHFGFARYQTMLKHRHLAPLASCLYSAATKSLRLRNLRDHDLLRENWAFVQGVLAARRGEDPFRRHRP